MPEKDGGGTTADAAAIEELVHGVFRARITVLSASGSLTQSVPDFVEPRRALLLGGSVTDFLEWETEGETLFGRDVACRRSRYSKKGVRDGAAFTGSGTKVFSFVRTNGAWRILTLLWQDDA